MDLRVQLSSCVPATELETSGARIEAADLLPLSRPPEGHRARRVHELPGRACRRSGLLAKLEALRRSATSTAMRRCCADATSTAISPPASAPTTRRTGADEALEKIRKGMTVLIREGSVSKDLARAEPPAHGRDLALHRALHRRPQPARHRRGGSPRPHDPHADRPRLPAARGLPRGLADGGAGVRACRPRHDRARPARRHRPPRRPRELRRRGGDLRRPDRRRGAVRDARAGRADRACERQGDAGHGRALPRRGDHRSSVRDRRRSRGRS